MLVRHRRAGQQRPRMERRMLTPTREHTRPSVQATGPPVLGALTALNDLDAIANLEVKVAIGLRSKVVQRHDVVHRRRWLGLERRWRWRCALRCRCPRRCKCRCRRQCRRRRPCGGRGRVWRGRWLVGRGGGRGGLPGAVRGWWGRRGLLG